MKTQNIIHENTKYKTQTQNIRTKEAQIWLNLDKATREDFLWYRKNHDGARSWKAY